MAVGQTFVILTAGIDLSVGSVLVLAGVVAGQEYYTHNGGQSGAVIWPVVIIGMACSALRVGGLVVGALQGFLVAKMPRSRR